MKTKAGLIACLSFEWNLPLGTQADGRTVLTGNRL